MTIDEGTINSGVTRILVYSVLLICICYDLIAFIFGWRTISSVLRMVDTETGTLLRWLMMAVWFHLFVKMS